MPDLIREGRACLATNLATFSYFIIQAFSFTSAWGDDGFAFPLLHLYHILPQGEGEAS